MKLSEILKDSSYNLSIFAEKDIKALFKKLMLGENQKLKDSLHRILTVELIFIILNIFNLDHSY